MEADYKYLTQFGPDLWRSCDPFYAGDMEKMIDEIDAAKITTFLDLEGAYQFKNFLLAKPTGIEWIHLPLGAILPPTEYEKKHILEDVLDDKRLRPLLMFCRKGVDRTGTMAATHRIRRQGWTRDQAVAEMIRMGSSPWLRWWTWSVK